MRLYTVNVQEEIELTLTKSSMAVPFYIFEEISNNWVNTRSFRHI